MFKSKSILKVIRIDGQIDQKTYEKFVKDTEDITESDKVILLVVNSPGGSPAYSEEIMNNISELKEKVAVFGYVESMAASGGYYIVSNCNKIFVNANAIIGSIGVILQKFDLSGLAETTGIKEDNLTVGDYKQPISLFKPISEEDSKYVKDTIMTPLYDVFMGRISTNRGIPLEELEEYYAKGRVFVGEKSGKLIDGVSSFSTVKKKLLESYDKYDYEVIDNTKKSFKEKLGFSINLNINSETFTKVMSNFNLK